MKSDCIEIKSKSWLPIASKEEILLLAEIKSVEHYIRQRDKLVYLLSIINHVAGTTRRVDKIFIEFKDQRDIYEITTGTFTEKKILTEMILNRIQSQSKR